jgi:hypothetical protein
MHIVNRLRLRGRTIEIGLHDGVAAVVERRGGVTRRYGAGEWSRLNRGGIAFAHAYHRGELGIESLLPDSTVEAMHASRPRRGGALRRMAAWLARRLRGLRPAVSAS